MGFLENSLAFVFVLGVMVLIHELGHFLAARYFDVRVEAFSIGFGPRLFGFRHGETDYKVCILPLGGFVKMVGENPSEPSDDPRGFLAKPRWQRLIIAFMGPLFNVILAVVLLAGLFMVRYERLTFTTEPAVIGYIAKDSPAEKGGIQQGDRIVSIDSKQTPTWESVMLTEIAGAHLTVKVTVERNGEMLVVPVELGADEKTGIGSAGWSERARVKLSPLEGKAAAKAGVEEGDILVAVDGEPIYAPGQVQSLIQNAAGKPVRLELRRNGETIEREVTAELGNAPGVSEQAWLIGVGLNPDYDRINTRLGLVDATREAIDQNVKNATLIFQVLGGMIEQRLSPKSITGPIGIARLSGEMARRGWPELIGLMAAISLNLGIFNLLPIPILDGGVITLLLFESVMRKDVSLVVKERIVQVGFVFLMLLFAFVMYNDIMKSLGTGG